MTWLVALLAGVAVTPQRALLARRELWAAVALAVALALPSVLWQAAHGFPFAELVAAARDKNAAIVAPLFVLNQILVMNPLFAPLWIAGLVAPFVRRDLAPMRFLGIAYVAVLALNLAGHGKDYYVAAAYPALFATGAIAFERVVRSALARGIVLAAAVALSAIAAPTSLAILDPVSLQAYIARFHLASQQQEKSFAGTALPQNFADQLGWRDFVREVGTAYASLPPDVRAHTAILVANYGEASALDLYGAPFGLPPALSPHNQFYLWGLRGQTPAAVLRVTRDVGGLRAHCGGVRVFGTTFSRWAMNYENGKTIALCTRPAPRLAEWWPELKNFS
ncbi:hypothetical protein WPS_01470 [Vulcanimicrobium alpinum]|uniref:Glycosyltransferase RgtA/B/C/D-like domain-containing protein n=1 Tax=Vulcanimicrobium alpinum TaxID=3016050 RepID=A0AAN2C8B9_UNVUL|nr:hypothetical protein [Vulcanimicrobium alpinum]BDE04871.1 hypothetical protein WPS_01470 [Vulcanimicrobium alpinum]